MAIKSLQWKAVNEHCFGAAPIDLEIEMKPVDVKCSFDRLLLASVSDLSLCLLLTRFWLILDIMESEGSQNKQIKPHKDALEVFGKALTLVAVTVSLPGGPEIWYFDLQANTPVNGLLYSWNPNEHKMIVKQYLLPPCCPKYMHIFSLELSIPPIT